ncbi:aspartate aminotransferase family protein, partial [Candidatus Woesearchaeota archaeon]|nr:aspartate aminotransferase family protein [Candidatus Woesearchaeota archaeon]
GRKEIISAKMGYHGKTLGALSLTKTLPKYNEPYLPLLLQHVKHFSYNDIESLKEVISDETAAVILEPIQGEGGIRIPDDDFIGKVKELCEKHGALLVADECQTGMGRTGKLFAIEHFNVSPDMLCLAKGICGGIPAAAVLVTEEIASKMYSGCHTNTFGGNPLVCAAGLATLNYIESNNLLENANEVGEYFVRKLREIDSPIVREVRGKGLMIAVELKVRMGQYAKEMQDEGLIVMPTGSTILRLLPPLILTKENVDEAVEVMKRVLVE